MSESIIAWEEPETRAPRRENRDWTSVAASLRENPNKTAKIAVGEANRQLASSIKSGKIAAFAPAGAFEASSRASKDQAEGEAKTFDIFASFVGEPVVEAVAAPAEAASAETAPVEAMTEAPVVEATAPVVETPAEPDNFTVNAGTEGEPDAGAVDDGWG